MREFFRGWRRKVGGVTLVMALLVCCGWVRSYAVLDAINVSTHSRLKIGARSTDGNVFLVLTESETELSVDPPEWLTGPPMTIDELIFSTEAEITDLRFFGVGLMRQKAYAVHNCWVDLPYWSITIPLTFLSAFLILWQPRKRTEPDHA